MISVAFSNYTWYGQHSLPAEHTVQNTMAKWKGQASLQDSGNNGNTRQRFVCKNGTWYVYNNKLHSVI